MSIYTDTIRHWATNTSRAGVLADADGTGEVGLDGADAGQKIAARFTIKLELGRVADIRYQVFGCGYSMAACAVAADLSIGYTLQELPLLNANRINDALEGLPEDRLYCADLAAEALQAAVHSAQNGQQPVSAIMTSNQEQHARLDKDDPVYRLLTGSQHPDGVSGEDRHLFACLLSIALQEPFVTYEALGLAESDLIALLRKFFPQVSYEELKCYESEAEDTPPEMNEDILRILIEHVPSAHNQHDLLTCVWLCYIITARAAHAGHLWVSMGLFKRSQLSAAIQQHLPGLIVANGQNMRWKRFLFKQVCDRNGGKMCKSPNCGECSDYVICFADDD